MSKPTPNSGRLSGHKSNKADPKSGRLSNRGSNRADPNSSRPSNHGSNGITPSRSKLSSHAHNSRSKCSRQTAVSSGALSRNGEMDNSSAQQHSRVLSRAFGSSTAPAVGNQITVPGNSVADITDIAFPTAGFVDTLGRATGSEFAAFLS